MATGVQYCTQLVLDLTLPFLHNLGLPVTTTQNAVQTLELRRCLHRAEMYVMYQVLRTIVLAEFNLVFHLKLRKAEGDDRLGVKHRQTQTIQKRYPLWATKMEQITDGEWAAQGLKEEHQKLLKLVRKRVGHELPNPSPLSPIHMHLQYVRLFCIVARVLQDRYNTMEKVLDRWDPIFKYTYNLSWKDIMLTVGPAEDPQRSDWYRPHLVTNANWIACAAWACYESKGECFVWPLSEDLAVADSFIDKHDRREQLWRKTMPQDKAAELRYESPEQCKALYPLVFKIAPPMEGCESPKHGSESSNDASESSKEASESTKEE